MFDRIADILANNIDNITKAWVDALRRTERTEVHNQMLTSEIVDGMKGLLSNLAGAVEERAIPDRDTMPVSLVPKGGDAAPPDASLSMLPARATRPLGGPLARAQEAAGRHGMRRQSQGYELHEVVMEYVKLRQVVWDSIRASDEMHQVQDAFAVTQYLDRLLDEMMLITLENFYSASVRDLEKRAIRDPLTQLYNKEYFHERLQEEVRRGVRYSQPLTVVMLDMDRLKEINDTYGHLAGDAAIVAVASVMQSTCRQSDVPCRYGGDEFAVILPETNKTHALKFAERLLLAMRNLTVVVNQGDKTADRQVNAANGGSGLPLVVSAPSVSIGLASFPEDGRNPEVLVARADAALYRAKHEGRDQLAF